jgi:HK97 family phage prohead protease
MKAHTELERRFSTINGVAGNNVVTGYAVVFDVRSQDLGGFREVVKPQAVDRALKSDARIVALYNHDTAAVLAHTPKTLTLTKDARGLAFSMALPDTTVGRDVYELVTRGDVAGASFGFRTIADTWRNEGGEMIRELLDVEIAEITLTAFPAYTQTDVSVAKRSLQKFQQQYGHRVDWLRRQLEVDRLRLL